MRRFRVSRIGLIVLALAGATPPAAEGLAPHGPFILTVSGAIDAPSPVRFDLAMLRVLPGHTIRTTSPWTDGVATFRGPLLRTVLAAVGARGTTITARALNDYAAAIPIADARRYPVLLALTRDGEPLSRRDKGPIWIVYPQDSYPELKTPVVHQRWVWQLHRLEVR